MQLSNLLLVLALASVGATAPAPAAPFLTNATSVTASAIATASPVPVPASTPAPGQCVDFSFPVTASASNKLIIGPNLNLTSVAGVTSFLGSVGGILGQLVGFLPQFGTYTIAATYCSPVNATQTSSGESIPAERAKHVQLLLHGLPYSRNYWTGLDAPFGTPNNWLKYATAQGYPVLSIDNLGHGGSDHPDAILVTQQALQTEILAQVARKLRSGTLAPAPKADKVIFVGHSIGSVTGNGVASRYPKAADSFDAVVLTGYTYTVVQSLIGVLSDQIEPAFIQSPSRFGNLARDPAYLTFASEDGKRNTYFGPDGSFLQAYPTFDVEIKQDTLSLGELVTLFNGLQAARGFKGDVFVLTGDQDAIFCGLGTRTLAVPSCSNATGNAGSGNIVANSRAFWPDAKSYEYYVVPLAGHAVTLHTSAPAQFAKVHDFLKRQGY